MTRRYPTLRTLLDRALDAVDEWEQSWGALEPHPSLAVDSEKLEEALDRYLGRLTAPPVTAPAGTGNYPFFHPAYAGQMLKPPHPVAVAAYAAAMRINPNNHALDGGPPTGQMEKEVVAGLAAMVGLPEETLGHLTGGGTVANLEALWVARSLHPTRGIAFSADAHYTHGRMAEVLGLDAHAVAATPEGQIDLEALEALLRTGRIGTVVLTAGTTGLGAVDRIESALPLLREYGVRLHVDAAYGGFFAILARDENSSTALPGFPAASFRAIASADSVVIDPHKHGLQPYGCGAVLFRDPSVGRFYRHDSPYTYFSSQALHLGEISLECSRPGAAAGALWLTLQVLPLRPDEGLGPVVAAGLRAARKWAAKLDASALLRLYVQPETDIVTYFPDGSSLSDIDKRSHSLFEQGMASDDPVFLSVFRMDGDRLAKRFPAIASDRENVRLLRSVLMKPEHEMYVEELHARVEQLASR